MQDSRLIMAKVEDGQSRSQVSLPILCTFDEHYSGAAAMKAKEMAMSILKSKPAFTHVTLEPVARPDLEARLKQVLNLNPSAIIHQRIYNPHQAEFRGYTELELDGFHLKYALRTSGFCSYAVVEAPYSETTTDSEINEAPLRVAS